MKQGEITRKSIEFRATRKHFFATQLMRLIKETRHEEKTFLRKK